MKSALLDPVAPPVFTEAVENSGALGQTVRPARHSLRSLILQYTVQEASTAVPLLSLEQQGLVTPSEPCNYLVIAPAPGATVFVSLGSNLFWQNMNSVYVPVALFAVPAGTQTLHVRIPNRRNWQFCVVPWAQNMVAGSTAAVAFAYGYIPDAVERWIKEAE